MTENALLESVVALAIGAGREILTVYNDSRQPEVTYKDDESPLTDADRRAHQFIVNSLGDLTPHIPVLSEESDAVGVEERLRWEQFWLVDPLDGTKEFIKRNGEFTVNIALVERGEPVLGVVHVPVTGVTYFGATEAPAVKRLSDGSEQAIRCHPLTQEGTLRVVASRSHRGVQVERLLEALAPQFAGLELVAMGSSLKICLLAEGLADLYPRLGPTSEWDTAAAHGVLLAAGGTLVDTAFNPLRYNQRESILNPYFIAIADPDFDWQSRLNGLVDETRTDVGNP